MGAYDVDINKREIIVDGHVCVETQYIGIYEVQDDYKVTITEWFHNKLNHNLTALYVYNGDHFSRQRVMYVTRYDNSNIERFKNDQKIKGVIISEMICSHCDGSIRLGGYFS